LPNLPADLRNFPATFRIFQQTCGTFRQPCRTFQQTCRTFRQPSELFSRPAELSGKPAESFSRPTVLSGKPAELFSNYKFKKNGISFGPPAADEFLPSGHPSIEKKNNSSTGGRLCQAGCNDNNVVGEKFLQINGEVENPFLFFWGFKNIKNS
jgi:hypothetical protein